MTAKDRHVKNYHCHGMGGHQVVGHEHFFIQVDQRVLPLSLVHLHITAAQWSVMSGCS